MWKNKTGKEGLVAWVIAIAIVYLVFVQGGGLFSASTAGTGDNGGTQVTSENTIKVVGAPCTQGTTLSNNPRRRYLETALSSENTTVLANGARLAVIGGGGGTTTVQSGANGQNIDLYYAEDRSTTYYTQHAKGKITECSAAASTGEDKYFKFVQDSSPAGAGVAYSDAPHKLVSIADGVTIDIVNDGQANAQNGNLNVGATGENLTIGQGGTGSVSLTYKVDYNEGWGVIGGNIMACQFPSAVYDSATPIVPTVAGKSLEEASVSVPSQIFPLIGANNTVKSFKFPGMDGRLTPSVSGSMILRASSNNNPANDLDRVNCTVFDTDYYQKQADGAYVLDIVNRDDNTDLGGANTVFDFVIGVE